MVTTALTRMVARLLLAPVLVVAVAVLIKGYVDVGDGFAAGVIAALGVLLQYLAFGRARGASGRCRSAGPPHVAIGGLLSALAVVFVPAAGRRRAARARARRPGAKVVHLGSLELLTAVAFDVGVFLLVLGAVVGRSSSPRPARPGGRRPREAGAVNLFLALVVARAVRQRRHPAAQARPVPGGGRPGADLQRGQPDRDGLRPEPRPGAHPSR